MPTHKDIQTQHSLICGLERDKSLKLGGQASVLGAA